MAVRILGIDHVVLCGVSTESCIAATARGAPVLNAVVAELAG